MKNLEQYLMKEFSLKKKDLIIGYLKDKHKYNITYFEYLYLYFKVLTLDKKQEILTSKLNTKLINELNPFDLRYKIVNKGEFNYLFNKYIKRDFLILNEDNKEEFRLFIKSRDKIFLPSLDNFKPKILDIKHTNEWNLHQELINTHHYIVEEMVTHHPIFNKITDKSLITIKFITLLIDNKVHILGSYLDIEINEEKYYILVDIDNGKTYDYGIHNYIKINKINDYEIKSFKIPYFKETLKMVYELPYVISNLKYLSFEIAITNNDCLLINASDIPNYQVLQFFLYLKDHDGLYKTIKNIRGEIK